MVHYFHFSVKLYHHDQGLDLYHPLSFPFKCDKILCSNGMSSLSTLIGFSCTVLSLQLNVTLPDFMLLEVWKIFNVVSSTFQLQVNRSITYWSM